MVRARILIGIVLIIIGLAMVATSVALIESEPSSSSVNHYSGDIYTSQTFNFSNNKVLFMVPSDNNSGLISYSTLIKNSSKLNSSNIENFSVKPVKDIDGAPFYTNLTGKYVYVSIASATPTMEYNFVSVSEFNDVSYASYIGAGGAVLLGTGFILVFITLMFNKLNSKK